MIINLRVSLLLNGKVDVSIPCAFSPRWNCKLATIMRMYAIIMAVESRLMNQPRTTAEELLQVKKARDATAVERSKAGKGTPLLVVLAKILGALPCFARPKMVRDAWKRRQFVQLHAEVMLQAVSWSLSNIWETYTTALQRSGRN